MLYQLSYIPTPEVPLNWSLETYQHFTMICPPAEAAVPRDGIEKATEPLVIVERQMRTSGPAHPEGCCRLKPKVLSLSGHESLSKTVFQGDLEDGRRHGQRQNVDIPAHAKTAHKGLLHKGLEEDLC